MRASISIGRTDRSAFCNEVPFFLQDAINSVDYPPALQIFQRLAVCDRVEDGLADFFLNALK
jgi:hypothetical protein